MGLICVAKSTFAEPASDFVSACAVGMTDTDVVGEILRLHAESVRSTTKTGAQIRMLRCYSRRQFPAIERNLTVRKVDLVHAEPSFSIYHLTFLIRHSEVTLAQKLETMTNENCQMIYGK